MPQVFVRCGGRTFNGVHPFGRRIVWWATPKTVWFGRQKYLWNIWRVYNSWSHKKRKKFNLTWLNPWTAGRRTAGRKTKAEKRTAIKPALIVSPFELISFTRVYLWPCTLLWLYCPLPSISLWYFPNEFTDAKNWSKSFPFVCPRRMEKKKFFCQLDFANHSRQNEVLYIFCTCFTVTEGSKYARSFVNKQQRYLVLTILPMTPSNVAMLCSQFWYAAYALEQSRNPDHILFPSYVALSLALTTTPSITLMLHQLHQTGWNQCVWNKLTFKNGFKL